jgi:hypothetical protein
MAASLPFFRGEGRKNGKKAAMEERKGGRQLLKEGRRVAIDGRKY